MIRIPTVALLALFFLHHAVAHATQTLPIRYSCVSEDGQSLLIQEGRKASVIKVNVGRTATAVCLAGSGKAALQWDWYSQKPARVSEKDPNDIDFHYVTQQISEACDPRLHPNPMASSVVYGSSCYDDVINDVRVNVTNPLDSELIERDRYAREYRSPLKCYEGYSAQTAQLIDVKARLSFAAPGACSMSKAYRESVREEQEGSEKLVSDYQLMLHKAMPAGALGVGAY